MANTFTLTSHSYGGRYMYAECYQTKDIAANKSPISWTLHSIGGSSNYYATDVTLTINGVDVYKSGRVNWEAKIFPAAKGSTSGTTYVDHDDYGKKTIEVAMTVMIYDGVYRTVKGFWELDSIPRQATLTEVPSSFTNATPPTIKYSNPAGDNASILEICIARKGGGVVVPYRGLDKNGTSYPFTSDDMEYLKNFAGNSGTADVRFVIYSKIGSTDFWSEQPSTFRMVEDDTTRPTATITIGANNGSLPSKFSGILIQGISRANVSISAQGKYGAAISSISAQIGGEVYNSASFTSNVIADNIDVVVTVKDTRGFTRTASKKIEVTPYSKPMVIPTYYENAILCYRSDEKGVRDGNSTSVWVKAKRFYYSINGLNRCKLQWRWKLPSYGWPGDEDWWNDLLSMDTTDTDEYSGLLQEEFGANQIYNIQIRAIDEIGEYTIKSLDVPKKDTTFHLGKGGKNVSVGLPCDYSRDYTFRSAWEAIFDKGISGTILNHTVGDVLAFAEQCAVGLTPFNTWTDSSNLPPSGNYQYCTGIVHKRHATQINVYLTDYISGKIAINVYYVEDGYNGWQGWKYITPQ